MVYVPGPSLEGCGFHSRKGQFLPVSSSLLLHRSSLFWCFFDMSSPEDTQTTEGSQEVPLTNSLKHAAACRSMPQRAAASQNCLGDRWCLASTWGAGGGGDASTWGARGGGGAAYLPPLLVHGQSGAAGRRTSARSTELALLFASGHWREGGSGVLPLVACGPCPWPGHRGWSGEMARPLRWAVSMASPPRARTKETPVFGAEYPPPPVPYHIIPPPPPPQTRTRKPLGGFLW